MNNFQNQYKPKLWHSFPVIILAFVLLVFFVVGVLGFASRAKEAYENRKVAESKIEDLKKRKENLKKDIDEIGTDLGKEKIFRENFGLGKPGEELVIIVDEKSDNMVKTPKKSGFFIFWQDLFRF